MLKVYHSRICFWIGAQDRAVLCPRSPLHQRQDPKVTDVTIAIYQYKLNLCADDLLMYLTTWKNLFFRIFSGFRSAGGSHWTNRHKVDVTECEQGLPGKG